MPWPDQQPAKLSPVDALRLVRELAADSANVGLTQHCRARMHGRRIASCSNCSLALISHDFQVSAGLGAGLCDADLGRIIRLYSINSKNTFHNAQTRPNAPNTAVIAPPITKGSNHFSSRSSKTIFPHF